jgi:hypothetical protein
MKLTGKPGTGEPYAGFDEAGAGNGQIPSTAPVLDPTGEGDLEIEPRLLRQFPTLPLYTEKDFSRMLIRLFSEVILLSTRAPRMTRRPWRTLLAGYLWRSLSFYFFYLILTKVAALVQIR